MAGPWIVLMQKLPVTDIRSVMLRIIRNLGGHAPRNGLWEWPNLFLSESVSVRNSSAPAGLFIQTDAQRSFRDDFMREE
jgi:hypothetical protein